ncbi:hypothetical protein RIF29_04718 [Crotalaria pallida]|uniref:MADS-box domain-containing protein n=1 Tax=Crotalaria pallida TaxID=3830 RepID=A0AAN9PAI9_CROPI
MARKKIDLAYITNDAKRRATLKKRKTGLMKKMDEISTLCGIEACAVIYSPNESQPEVWPSHLGVQKALYKFSRMPEMEQSKKMMNQESFLSQSIMKATEQLKKQQNEIKKKETALLMSQCLSTGNLVGNVNMVKLDDLSFMIDQTLKEIEENILKTKPREGTSTVGNGAGVVNGGQAIVEDHVQGMMQTNMDGMQQNWSMNPFNGGGNEMPPFEEFNNISNGIWNGPYFP